MNYSITELQLQLAKLQRENEAICNVLSRVRERNAEHEAELSELQRKLDDSEKWRDFYSRSCDSASDRWTTLHKFFVQYHDEAVRLSYELKDANLKIAELRCELSETKKKANGNIVELSGKLKQAETREAKLQTRVAELEKYNRSLIPHGYIAVDEPRETLLREIATLQKQLREAKQREDAFRSEIEELKEEAEQWRLRYHATQNYE